ncbi:DUF2237 family protein [Chitinilyticum piscinae]|uniref:DUF2237 domain-containing protein n=1 Tax=Chitinilyticum piscinae TaxID=2866724 RepID=A0A8J7FNP5_9NEIS|nr:DUF2237 domain-containing protein [Chitinilyticum piscinae]MBE9609434.1 DUF2237 domain-containing protein [Chitinilyticum piscinae]
MQSTNVLGQPLQACSHDPLTGYLRDGCCHSLSDDPGQHTMCVQVSAAFLAFSRQRGNDLSTPRPEYGFPGLKPGDRWCLCALRWVEALQAGVAPPLYLAASDEQVLDYVSLETLVEYAIDRPAAG